MTTDTKSVKFYKTKLGRFILSLFVVFGVIYLFGILVIPYKNIHKDSLQGRLRLSETLKNFPITMACTKPRFTENIADCGGAACPDTYDIHYATRAKESEIINVIESYIKSLDKPHEYYLFNQTDLYKDEHYRKNSKVVKDKTCTQIMISFNSLSYLEGLPLNE